MRAPWVHFSIYPLGGKPRFHPGPILVWVASSVKPGARYPVKGETAVCPLCNGLFVLKKPKYCPVEQKWMPSEFRKHPHQRARITG